MVDDRRQPCQSPSARNGRSRRQPGYGAYKRGLNSKIHMAVDAHGNPIRTFITSGTRADCSEAESLVSPFKPEFLIGDKGYDSQSIIDFLEERNIVAVIPPRKNRKDQRAYDTHLYKMRHLVENIFLRLKEWRGIATRYAKNTASYLAAVHIRCLFHWLRIS